MLISSSLSHILSVDHFCSLWYAFSALVKNLYNLTCRCADTNAIKHNKRIVTNALFILLVSLSLLLSLFMDYVNWCIVCKSDKYLIFGNACFFCVDVVRATFVQKPNLPIRQTRRKNHLDDEWNSVTENREYSIRIEPMPTGWWKMMSFETCLPKSVDWKKKLVCVCVCERQ